MRLLALSLLSLFFISTSMAAQTEKQEARWLKKEAKFMAKYEKKFDKYAKETREMLDLYDNEELSYILEDQIYYLESTGQIELAQMLKDDFNNSPNALREKLIFATSPEAKAMMISKIQNEIKELGGFKAFSKEHQLARCKILKMASGVLFIPALYITLQAGAVFGTIAITGAILTSSGAIAGGISAATFSAGFIGALYPMSKRLATSCYPYPQAF